MKVEKQLYDALVVFLASRNKVLGEGPMDSLMIPLKDDQMEIVPIMLINEDKAKV